MGYACVIRPACTQGEGSPTMSTTARNRDRRGPWSRPAPDGRPSCPGCGRALANLSQPDGRQPGQLLGSCDNPACGEWVSFTAADGRRPARDDG